jgi:hypothetical protein
VSVWKRGVSCPVTVRKAEPYLVEHHGVITGEVCARVSTTGLIPANVARGR